MTRQSLVRLVLLCGVLGSVATIRADEPKKTDPKEAEIAALREKLAQQADEIRRLEAKVKDLEAKQNLKLLFTPPQIVPAPGVPGRPGNEVPPNWVPKEFNGMTYYLIPLAENGAKAAAPVVVTPAAGPKGAGEAYTPASAPTHPKP